MHESEKWKWSHSVMSDPQWPHGLQSSWLLHPWDFLGKSTGVGCHCLLCMSLLVIYNSFAPCEYKLPFVGLGKTITPKLNPSSNFVICVPHQDLFFSHFVLTNKGLSLNDAKKFLQQDFYLKVILLQRYISGAMLILPRQFTVVFTEKSPSKENMKIY